MGGAVAGPRHPHLRPWRYGDHGAGRLPAHVGPRASPSRFHHERPALHLARYPQLSVTIPSSPSGHIREDMSRLIEQVGGFDERLDVGAAGCSGDSEMWYRIMASGGTCRYEPTAVVFHRHRRDLESFKQQIFSYMRGHVAALLIQFEKTGHWGNLRRLFLALIIVSATQAERPASSVRYNPCGAGSSGDWFKRTILEMAIGGRNDDRGLIFVIASILYQAPGSEAYKRI